MRSMCGTNPPPEQRVNAEALAALAARQPPVAAAWGQVAV